MKRFYCLPENIKKDTIFIKDREAHHIAKVMRLKEKDKIIVFDGSGKEYAGFIQEILPREIRFKIQEIKVKSCEGQYPKVILAVSVPKKNKMDYLIEKCTELGVDTIIPLKTERAIINLRNNSMTRQIARWERISIEASKQSGRKLLPKIEQIRQFSEFLIEVQNYDLKILFCLTNEKRENLLNLLSCFKGRNILGIIGPEGDFTSKEINLAKERGCVLVSLGESILKVDTAAITVMAVLSQYRLKKSAF